MTDAEKLTIQKEFEKRLRELNEAGMIKSDLDCLRLIYAEVDSDQIASCSPEFSMNNQTLVGDCLHNAVLRFRQRFD